MLARVAADRGRGAAYYCRRGGAAPSRISAPTVLAYASGGLELSC